MTTPQLAWPSIELLHSIVRTFDLLNEQGTPLPKVRYFCKIKQHGVNVSVAVFPEGVRYFSKTGEITRKNDLHGFVRWASTIEDKLAALPMGTVMFGEWCGPGVEGGMAVSALKDKVWVIFAVVHHDGSEDPRITYEPSELERFVSGLGERVHVLPWFKVGFNLDFSNKSDLNWWADRLSAHVEAVELEDPWVKDTFGVSGVGEGLVLYPVTVNDVPVERLTGFALHAFKAKGDKHRTVSAKKAVQVNPDVVASAQAFAVMVVTEARMEQGAKLVDEGRSPKNTGRFVQWIWDDVVKETASELAASGLTLNQVKPKVQEVARTWWLRR